MKFTLVLFLFCMLGIFGSSRIEAQLEQPHSKEKIQNDLERCSPYFQRIQEEIVRLRELAKEEKEQGHLEEAQKLLQQAQELEELREQISAKKAQGKDIAKEIEKLSQRAQELEERGQIEKAEQIWNKIELLRGIFPNEPGKEEREEEREQEIKKLLEFLQEFDPEKLEHLRFLEREKPYLYLPTLEKYMNIMREMLELKKQNFKKYQETLEEKKLTRASWEVAEAYKKEKNLAKKEQLKKELQGILTKIFILKIKKHKEEIQNLTSELERLKRRLQRRIANKNRIIEKRLQEMIGEEEEFDW